MSWETAKPVGRWESQRGRYWIELRGQHMGFVYRTDNGGGSLGCLTIGQAICEMESRVSQALLWDGIRMKRVQP